jgi:hypothetical protein
MNLIKIFLKILTLQNTARKTKSKVYPPPTPQKFVCRIYTSFLKSMKNSKISTGFEAMLYKSKYTNSQ